MTSTHATAQHTPGPWKVSGTQVRTSDGLFIAECGPEKMNGAENDARLIASAPALLAALKAISEYCISGARYETQNPYTVTTITNALEAIRAAEGRTS